MQAKTSVGWIEETIERARAEFFDSKKGILSVESTLNNGVVQGVTIERRLKVNGKRFARADSRRPWIAPELLNYLRDFYEVFA